MSKWADSCLTAKWREQVLLAIGLEWIKQSPILSYHWNCTRSLNVMKTQYHLLPPWFTQSSLIRLNYIPIKCIFTNEMQSISLPLSTIIMHKYNWNWELKRSILNIFRGEMISIFFPYLIWKEFKWDLKQFKWWLYKYADVVPPRNNNIHAIQTN